jgi:hypothetical protein
LSGDEAGDLVALEPVEAQSPTQAISGARTLATTKAGAIAFSRIGDPDIDEFEDAKVLWQVGDIAGDALGA